MGEIGSPGGHFRNFSFTLHMEEKKCFFCKGYGNPEILGSSFSRSANITDGHARNAFRGEEDEEVAFPLSRSIWKWIIFIPDEHVGVASAYLPSEDAMQFHNLVDRVVSFLNLPAVPVEETFHTVFNMLGPL